MDFQTEIETLSRIEIVNQILKVLMHETGMRIALVARVTEDSWTACAVLDNADFGLKAGDNLEFQTTY